MISLKSLAVLAGLLGVTNAAIYGKGACPNVTAEKEFNMDKFLGKWHVIWKTHGAHDCLTYNYRHAKEPGKYLITERYNYGTLGRKTDIYTLKTIGELTVPDPKTPGHMEVHFPLNMFGKAAHIVLETDYRSNYAVVVTCQKVGPGHRLSVMLLSRYQGFPSSVSFAHIRQQLVKAGIADAKFVKVKRERCAVKYETLSIKPNQSSFTNLLAKTGQLIHKAMNS